MKARIYKPARNAMQSGEVRTRHWMLVFTPESRPFIEPLMGWTGSADMPQEVELHFHTREEAMAYAEKNGIEFDIIEPPKHETTLKPKSYAANFAYNRVQDEAAQ